MGTQWHVSIITPQNTTISKKIIQNMIEMKLNHVDLLMSAYKYQSDVSKFNRAGAGEIFKFNPDTFKVILASIKVSRQSYGMFDITAGRLVKLWGFGPAIKTQTPSAQQVRDALSVTGYKYLNIFKHDDFLSKNKSGVEVDLSAIAKGFAVDKVASAISDLGISNFIIEVGGEMKVSGENEFNKPWKVGIEYPEAESRRLWSVINITNAAIATSGNYRNSYEIDGKLYSHIINVKTGYPVNNQLVLVSVIHKDCMWADAYATAIMASGTKEGIRLANTLNLPVLIIEQLNGNLKPIYLNGFPEM